MAKTKARPNVYAFIDSQNLNLGVKSQGWKLDFTKFHRLLKDKYQVKKAFLFIGFIPTNASLYTKLQEDGYVLVYKPVLLAKHKTKKAFVKGNVDAELVLHAMIQYRNYDQAVIVTGDGDFHCLVEYLQSQGKLKKIIVPNLKYSSLLRQYAKHIVNISQFKNKVQGQKKRGIPSG